jgi:hypothetical protein
MISIVDGSFPAGTFATAVEYSWASGVDGNPSVCYLHESSNCSSLCFTNVKEWYANVLLDPSQISSPPFGRDVHFMTRAVLAHEVGHTLGINEYNGDIECADTTLMSALEILQCGFSVPQQCDTSFEQSIYSGWTVYSWASCGPTCDGSTNCN